MPSSALARAVALAVAASGLALVPGTAQASDPLTSDAEGPVTVQRDRGGRVFASTRAGDSLDNPRVGPSTSPRSAARSHLDRYGAGLGVDDADFDVVATTPLASGGDVVRSQQQADGLPVLGGEVVMVLEDDRSLASVQASVVDVPQVETPQVGRADAEARALAVVRKQAGADVRVSSARRVVLDPALFELPAGAATAWEVEVGNGLEVRRHVYLDDRSGGVVRVVDLVQHLDRVVCDAANVRGAGESCTDGFARQEGQGATGVTDVDLAYDLAGEVAAMYASAGVDLAAMLSTVPDGSRLAATVRFCEPLDDTRPETDQEPCPWPNAAWNGSQMLYGQGFAAADDVVGHEMTHGFVQHTSNLFYFGQPGAINESMADVVGELLDQRRGSDDDSAWHLGEDLPGGAVRSMSNPTVAGDPDSTASRFWHTDASDAEGVHLNSGVGNKTAYLISRGGSFGGQTVTGIDAGDPTRTKTLLLYLDTIRSLGSASDYAALGRTLVATCQRLVGTEGFTAGDCTQVQRAVAATQLAKRPANLGKDPSASMTCPDGTKPTVVRTLEDFETPAPEIWQQVPRDPSFAVPAPGETAWYADDYAAMGRGTVPLITRGVALRPQQLTYLFLEHWFAFETDPETGEHYDGGIVDTSSPDTLAASRWANGPSGVLFGSDVVGFAGSSRGWTSSRVDLTGLRTSASGTVDVALALSADDTGFEQGWYVRQATVYTCPVGRLTAGTAAVQGTPRVGSRLAAVTPRAWGPAPVALSYQWLRGSTPIAGAKQRTYVPTTQDVGRQLRVRVTGAKPGFAARTVVSGLTGRVQGVLRAGRPAVRGKATVGTRLRASVRWTPRSTRSSYQWLRNGRPIKGATRSSYRLVAKDRGRRISVRVTGRLKDHVTRTVTSRSTAKVRR
ncbi:M4 family metallopeptidase [Aeromicrobium massiliense]|uniref:M4 family metallopeptidase n=1 Tax=Aeromicrobium massiliense TaxID=1464554 RepID=UPI0005782FAA|nr:M4 family metallopeptidase [Aeromicrobium massiliense]